MNAKSISMDRLKMPVQSVSTTVMWRDSETKNWHYAFAQSGYAQENHAYQNLCFNIIDYAGSNSN